MAMSLSWFGCEDCTPSTIIKILVLGIFYLRVSVFSLLILCVCTMADKIHRRKEILEKVSNNQTLNLDGFCVFFRSLLEQDEFISYARSEIERQRNIWRVSLVHCFHFLVLLYWADCCVYMWFPVRNDGRRVGYLPKRRTCLDSGSLPLLHGSPVSKHLHHAMRCYSTCFSPDVWS